MAVCCVEFGEMPGRKYRRCGLWIAAHSDGRRKTRLKWSNFRINDEWMDKTNGVWKITFPRKIKSHPINQSINQSIDWVNNSSFHGEVNQSIDRWNNGSLYSVPESDLSECKNFQEIRNRRVWDVILKVLRSVGRPEMVLKTVNELSRRSQIEGRARIASDVSPEKPHKNLTATGFLQQKWQRTLTYGRSYLLVFEWYSVSVRPVEASRAKAASIIRILEFALFSAVEKKSTVQIHI